MGKKGMEKLPFLQAIYLQCSVRLNLHTPFYISLKLRWHRRDHLPTPCWNLLTFGQPPTTYHLPCHVNVVCERPLWLFAFEGCWKQRKDWPFYVEAWKVKSKPFPKLGTSVFANLHNSVVFYIGRVHLVITFFLFQNFPISLSDFYLIALIMN